MKFLIAGFYHESNTFNPILTKKEDFIEVTGKELLDYFPGAVSAFREAGAEVVPCTFAGWMSSGVIEESAYRYYVDKIVGQIRAQDNISGIWLQLHGAIYAENIGCGELFMLRKIRSVVGYDIPIAIGMDPHGNLSPDITKYANILRAYHTAPHEDQQDTYRVTAEALIDFAKRGVKIEPAFVRLPMLLCGDTALTRDEPLRSVISRCKEMEASGEAACASFFISMHSANTENTYPAVVIVPRNPENYEKAMRTAREIAEEIYDKRHKFRFEGELMEPEKAIEMAFESEVYPVVISDSGDNTTAGGTGMNTYFLKLFLEKGRFNGKRVLVSTIYDRDAYHKLKDMADGEAFDIMLGTGVDEWSLPVRIRGKIKSKGHVLVYHPMRSGLNTYAGGLITVTLGDLDVTICEVADSFTDMEQCRVGNFRAEDYDIVVVKQAYQFPDIVKFAKKQIIALTPGATYQDLKAIRDKYTKLPWTLWPFTETD